MPSTTHEGFVIDEEEKDEVHAASELDFAKQPAMTLGKHDDDQDFSDDEQEERDFKTLGETLSHDLSNRHSEKQLENAGVIKGKRSSNLSSKLAAPAVSLEHHLVADKLAHELKVQPPPKHHQTNISSVLAGPAQELTKHMTADKLSKALTEERKKSDLGMTQQQARRKSDLSAMLAAPAKELEHHMKMDAVSHKLSKRSSQSELIDRGVLPPTNVAPALAAPAKELEKHMVTDKLHQATQQQHKGGDAPGTIRDRVLEYQKQAPQATSKFSLDPKAGGKSLKDRMAAYAQATGKKE